MKQTIQQIFLFSIVRHLLTMLSGILVSWGWVDAETANHWTVDSAMKIVAGLISFVGPLYWSYRDKIREFVEKRIAILLPPDTHVDEVAAIANAVQDKKAVALGNMEEVDITSGRKQ